MAHAAEVLLLVLRAGQNPLPEIQAAVRELPSGSKSTAFCFGESIGWPPGELPTAAARTILISLLAVLATSARASAGDRAPAPLRLSVTRFVARRSFDVPAGELRRYLGEPAAGPARACGEDDLNDALRWFRSHRIPREDGECNGECIHEFPRNPNRPDRDAIDYYFAETAAGRTPVLFIRSGWQCPRPKTVLVALGEYPFLDPHGRFNYVGDNRKRAAASFTLRPHRWDPYQHRYAEYTPPFPPNDGASLLVYSPSGYRVAYRRALARAPTAAEKRLVLGEVLAGFPGASCIERITLVKLATAGPVSRFVGTVVGGTWFIADVAGDRVDLTVLEGSQYGLEFHSAYAFGEGTLPDVFVWTTESGKSGPPYRDIYYRSGDRWVVTSAAIEFTGDCFIEPE